MTAWLVCLAAVACFAGGPLTSCFLRAVPLQDGQLRWNRLENLMREGSKSSDFDAGQLWLLANWLMSPNAGSVRQKLAVELAKMLDATAAADARSRIAQR